MKKYLNIKTRSKQHICENHFDANAFKPHGQTQFKRLVEAALPNITTSKTTAIDTDHCYFPNVSLNMVSIY